MGLADKHLTIMCLALAKDGLIRVKVGDPLLESMVSMKLMERAGIVNGGRNQYYQVTRAGEAAYVRYLQNTED